MSEPQADPPDKRTVPLAQLLAAAGIEGGPAVDERRIAGIATDSRRVRPGDLFVAYRGLERDGHAYVARAVAAGAAAVVAEQLPQAAFEGPIVLVDNGRVVWAQLCAAWEGHPSRRLRLAGVTGTDGKTTTASLLHHILTAAGVRAGIVSTVAARIGDRSIDTGLHTTTPPPSDVQAYLAEMVAAGCTAAVLEATSEGLAQQRLVGCDFDTAIVTNVTHDHLYYHGSFEAYREAKATLFRYLDGAWRKEGVPKVAVLNRDDGAYEYLRTIAADRHLSYGEGAGDVAFAVVEEGEGHLRLRVDTPWGPATPSLPMPGRYNAYNIAAALAAACVWGVDVQEAAEAVGRFRGIEGRMDFVRFSQPFNVVVDFAHTAFALESALKAARAWTSGRLIVVFGCAGERDRLKRAPMAQAAVRLADLSLFTAEDPRREDLAAILEQMATAAEAVGARAGREYLMVPDRAAAIRTAVAAAAPGDTVLLCGKGHEQSMCYGTDERPWSERGSAEAALRALGYLPAAAPTA